MGSQVYRYDFTRHVDSNSKTLVLEEIQVWVDKYCKNWCFQLEAGAESGALHFQGRISLTKKVQIGKLITFAFSGAHWSHTSNACTTFDYVMKSDTRVDGPWADNDTVQVPTKDIIGLEDHLFPWQSSLLTMAGTYDPRVIDVILDPVGNRGKTVFRKFLAFHKHALWVPTINNSKDLLQCVASMGISKCYIVDFPKSDDQKVFRQLYAAVENIKSGTVYDTRYKFKVVYMDPPRVFIFTNSIPPPEYLSLDRWHYWEISADEQLTRIYPPHVKYPPVIRTETRPGEWDVLNGTFVSRPTSPNFVITKAGTPSIDWSRAKTDPIASNGAIVLGPIGTPSWEGAEGAPTGFIPLTLDNAPIRGIPF